MWGNCIAKHWDMFLEHHLETVPPTMLPRIEEIKFKSQDSEVGIGLLRGTRTSEC
jgi:hypothetical protein